MEWKKEELLANLAWGDGWVDGTSALSKKKKKKRWWIGLFICSGRSDGPDKGPLETSELVTLSAWPSQRTLHSD